jgi:hypothetical protein
MGVMMHTCNPNTQETEAGGSQSLSQPGLHSKTQSQNSSSDNNTHNFKNKFRNDPPS